MLGLGTLPCSEFVVSYEKYESAPEERELEYQWNLYLAYAGGFFTGYNASLNSSARDVPGETVRVPNLDALVQILLQACRANPEQLFAVVAMESVAVLEIQQAGPAGNPD